MTLCVFCVVRLCVCASCVLCVLCVGFWCWCVTLTLSSAPLPSSPLLLQTGTTTAPPDNKCVGVWVGSPPTPNPFPLLSPCIVASRSRRPPARSNRTHVALGSASVPSRSSPHRACVQSADDPYAESARHDSLAPPQPHSVGRGDCGAGHGHSPGVTLPRFTKKPHSVVTREPCSDLCMRTNMHRAHRKLEREERDTQQ